MTLSKRLAAVAEYIAPGAHAADIGTDHAFLPIWLVQNRGCASVIATDVHPGPLERARASAAESGVAEEITFMLTDGLAGIGPDEVDTVILAGMGGETILRILAAAPWLKQDRRRLILQPQSKINVLTMWLCRTGYRIEAQRLVKEGGKLYTVIKAAPGPMEMPDDAGRYVSKALYESGDPLLEEYVGQIISKLSRALAGVERAGDDSARAAHLKAAVSGLTAMKERLVQWK